ncbi:vesicular-fusion protein SEC18 [Pluteus cervinus]|uniref:Vesicular-fusion protein SEC18 n=1 Tax=Pluteus cervinus TaxID=181527 RepID=A0ACD3AMT9_9AGAR|nr:vesicular-fusion protein SEC18 [Pluteus cervinus]
MSFFRGNSNNPQPPYRQGDGGAPYSSLPSGPRVPPRQPPPASAQYNPPRSGYNDPSGALFEKSSGYDRRSQPQQAHFDVVPASNEILAQTNCLLTNASDFPDGVHVLVKGGFALTTRSDRSIQPGAIGANAAQRQWIGLSKLGDQVSVESLPTPPHPMTPAFLQSIDLEVGFLRKNQENSEVFSADDMARNFVKAYSGVLMSTGQDILFEFHGQNLKATVKGVLALELADEQRRGPAPGHERSHDNLYRGVIMEKTDVNILQAPGSGIKIKTSAKKAPANAIIAPNFKFEDMGIGGLDTEFSDIFRRAFASRVFPPGLVEKLGIQHVKGILLHGPPGTGKTLIARQIGKMLNAREPKVVNGPEVLSKYVGQSEENIRKLFEDAEKEYKQKGEESGLHIIIFDELDAIFKQRGSTNSGTGVGDTVVNQILSKMDGVEQLNNILIIGMTNRKDMIDEALLRPGRLEVHMEISLPDEQGRYQILNIHTAKMRTNNVMDVDVDLYELASLTKNFSGAEIGGLIKSATSFAFNRHVKVGTMAGISDDVENLKVNRNDFISAMDEVHPAFGVSEEELLQVIQNGIIHFNDTINETLRSGKLLVEQVRTSTRTPLVSVLLYGPPGAGKTALGAQIAQSSEFPFIKLISPDDMVGFGELQKVTAINKVFADSYKSPLSVVVVDNVERLIDWTPLGARFSNAVLQALLVLVARRPPKGHRLLVIVTTSLREVLTDVGFADVFDTELRIEPVSDLPSLEAVVREVNLFESQDELRRAMRMLREARLGEDGGRVLQIGIKKLLSTVEMARQEPESVAERLLSALIGLGM